jgi:hypothetical protein
MSRKRYYFTLTTVGVLNPGVVKMTTRIIAEDFGEALEEIKLMNAKNSHMNPRPTMDDWEFLHEETEDRSWVKSGIDITYGWH